MTPTAQTHRMTEALRAHYAAALAQAFAGTRFHARLTAGGVEGLAKPEFTLFVDGGDTNGESAEAMAKAVQVLRGLTEARIRRVRVKGKLTWRAGADVLFGGYIRRGIRWTETVA